MSQIVNTELCHPCCVLDDTQVNHMTPLTNERCYFNEAFNRL